MAEQETGEIYTEKQVKNAEKMVKYTTKTKEELGVLNKLTKTFGDNLSNIVNTFTAINLANIGSNLLDTAKNMTTLNSELHRSVINAGKGVEGLKAYKDISVSLSRELGATFEEASKVTQILATKQYAGTTEDIKNAADSSFLLAKAFGLTEEEITNNTVELQKWGGISAATTTAMYTDIMKVAQANGLTKEAVSAINKTTQEYSGTLKAFGKAPQDIQKFNLSLAKSVSALEKVGIQAGKTTELIQHMLDPENIEANIPAFAAMGVSISDAISGNLQPDAIAGGLKQVGEKLKQMGPIAGAAYAKTMGISYKDAIKAASADLQETAEDAMTPEESAAQQMKELTENTKDFFSKMQSGIEKIKGAFRSLGPLMLVILSALFPVIMDFITNSFAKAIKKSTSESTEEGITEGTTKGAKTAKERLAEELSKATSEASKNASENYNAVDEMAQQMKENAKAAKSQLAMIYEGLSAKENYLKREAEANQKKADEGRKLNQIREAEIAAAERIATLKEKMAVLEDGQAKEALAKAIQKKEIELESLKEQKAQQMVLFANASNQVANLARERRTSEEKLQGAIANLQKSNGYKVGKALAVATDKAMGAAKWVTSLPKKMGNKVKEAFSGAVDRIPLGGFFKNLKAGFAATKLKLNTDKPKSQKEKKEKTGGGGKSPLGLLLLLLAPLIAILKDDLKPLLDSVIEQFKPLVQMLSGAIKPALEQLMSFLPTIIEAIKPLLDTIIGAIGPLLDALMGILNPIMDLLKPIFDLVNSLLGLALDLLMPALQIIGWVLQKVVTPILKGIIWVINKVVEAIRGFIKKLIPWTKSNDKVSSAVEENTEAQKEANEKGPERITNNGGVATVSKTTGATTASTASTQTTARQSAVTGNTTSNRDNGTAPLMAMMITKLEKLNDKLASLGEENKKMPYNIRNGIQEALGLDGFSKTVKVEVESNTLAKLELTR